MTTKNCWIPAALAAVLALAGYDTSEAAAERPDAPPSFADFECGFRSSGGWLAEIRRGLERGEIADLRSRPTPELPPPQPAGAGPAQCLTREHIFPYEDTFGLLLTNFTGAQFKAFQVDAANSVLATYGDNYDFIGFWVNFTPHHTIGAAFYSLVSNDVTGIGDVGAVIGQPPTFDLHGDLGLAGQRIQGFITMWNINSGTWQSGNQPNADFTRLALGQEFEHRFAMFMPSLNDGRVLQGDDGSCGRTFHWNWKVDGQGSSMEISEWVGSNPADLVGSFVTFNTDIPTSVFSYTDLYLMGYVSPAEMDAGNSELRYMDGSLCGGSHFGTISTFTSADLIAAAGARNPGSQTAQKDFRTAWVMIHQPGDLPSDLELDKAVAIHQQHMIDWNVSTIGRGTMDNSLFTDCNCNGVPDGDDISGGGSGDINGNGIPDECEPCIGDLDGNGFVDVVDLFDMFADWFGSGPADLNGDGIVDILDLFILFGNWGQCP